MAEKSKQPVPKKALVVERRSNTLPTFKTPHLRHQRKRNRFLVLETDIQF